jgi:hypothetical protein
LATCSTKALEADLQFPENTGDVAVHALATSHRGREIVGKATGRRLRTFEPLPGPRDLLRCASNRVRRVAKGLDGGAGRLASGSQVRRGGGEGFRRIASGPLELGEPQHEAVGRGRKGSDLLGQGLRTPAEIGAGLIQPKAPATIRRRRPT